tara:strand:+ start:4717 stop:4980 length:264 start_codon:yes stop_codon:yes gene_type:complete
MELTKIAEHIKDLPTKEKMAILELIDIKIASDMKEVITELKFTRESLEQRMTSDKNSLEHRMNSQTKIVTLAISFLGLLITLFKFLE